MGAYWLLDLPDWFDDAGLEWRCWPGWEQRSRSSGGYDQLWAVIVHHTASNTSPDNDCSYMWGSTSGDQPIGAVLLERTGRVTIGAAGATNCAGKGGPMPTSHGTIPVDKGNSYAFNIEAANAGTGEHWSDVMLDAYTLLVATLCDHLALDVERDCWSHFEWAPDRKIDPAGPDRYASGSASWDMGAFRSDVATCSTAPTPPPEPQEDEVTDDDIERIADAVWRRQMMFRPTSKQMTAQDLLETTAHYACNADMQTRSET